MEKFTMNDTTIAFIGLGLIGGSLAKGIKRARPDIRIMAYMRTRSKLEQAKKDGIVDVILDGIDEQLKECDLIFLCTPVELLSAWVLPEEPAAEVSVDACPPPHAVQPAATAMERAKAKSFLLFIIKSSS